MAAPAFSAGLPLADRPVRNFFAARRETLVILPLTFVAVSLLESLIMQTAARTAPWLQPPSVPLTVAILVYGLVVNRLNPLLLPPP